MKPRALGKERGNMKEWAEWFYKSKEWAQTKDGVRVTVIETYKDKQAQQTFRPGKEFVVTAERAEVLVAAGVAKITK